MLYSLAELVSTVDENCRICGPTRGTSVVNKIEGGDGMRCLMCQNDVQVDVLNFWGERICGPCEERIMDSSAEDDDYEELIGIFRLLWQRRLLASRSHHIVEGDRLC